MEGLVGQLKVIRNTKLQWGVIVKKSDELVTSLSYNLMREQRLIVSGSRDDSAWSVKEIPKSSTAVAVFLTGDVEGASKIAAAERIESDFDKLEAELQRLRRCLATVEKASNSLAAISKLSKNPNPLVKGIQSEESKRFESFVSWPALLGEAAALVRRLRNDLDLRIDLMRHIAPAVVKATMGDFAAPQRLCFAWRQASEIVRWENFTDYGNEILEANKPF